MASLATIHSGDMVEVEIAGRRGICKVDRKEGRELVLIPVTANFTWRRATGRQVLTHWRRTKNSGKVKVAPATDDPFAK